MARRDLPSDAQASLAAAVRRCYQGRLRQGDLATAVGVHQSKVSKWATGTMQPSLAEISAIEAACQRSRGYILTLAGRVTEAGWREGLLDLDEGGDGDP